MRDFSEDPLGVCLEQRPPRDIFRDVAHKDTRIQGSARIQLMQYACTQPRNVSAI